MNVLVVGSNGQLASEFKNSLVSRKLKFIFLGKKEINIFSYQDILLKVNKHKVSIIINCAAYTDVDKAEIKRRSAYKLNCEAVKNITKVCKLKNIYLIHFSTDFVFKGDKSNYKEKDSTKPISYYGETKKISEQIINKNLNSYVIFRLSWLIGRYSDNFLKKIHFNFKKKNKLLMVNDQVNNPTTTILVSNVIKICCENFYCKKNILKGIYHLANEPAISKLEFTKFIYSRLNKLKLINSKCEIVGVSSNIFKNIAKRPINSSFNLSKIKTKLKIKNLNWKSNINKILIKL